MNPEVTTALDWLSQYRESDAFAALAPSAREEAEFAVRAFTIVRAGAKPSGNTMDAMTSAEVIDVLAVQIPKSVSANDPKPFLDALVGFLTWGVKSGHIRERGVEFACKKVRADAETAMRDERRWSVGKTIATLAMRDGVDPSNLEQLRAHAIARGVADKAIDESLPPPPVTLGSGRWLWVD